MQEVKIADFDNDSISSEISDKVRSFPKSIIISISQYGTLLANILIDDSSRAFCENSGNP